MSQLGHSRSGRASTKSGDVRYAAENGVAPRHDKLANHLAFAKLASIRVWLRAKESTLRRGRPGGNRAQTL